MVLYYRASKFPPKNAMIRGDQHNFRECIFFVGFFLAGRSMIGRTAGYQTKMATTLGGPAAVSLTSVLTTI